MSYEASETRGDHSWRDDCVCNGVPSVYVDLWIDFEGTTQVERITLYDVSAGPAYAEITVTFKSIAAAEKWLRGALQHIEDVRPR